MSSPVIQQVDHLVYATRDVDVSCAELEKLLGVRASEGGQHPGRGTRNALIAIGQTTYLEIIGPDWGQPEPIEPRMFGIDRIDRSGLVTWAAKSPDLKNVVAKAAKAGVQLGKIGSGSRCRADGVTLNWKFTDPGTVVLDGLVPFFIDWGSEPHPAVTAVRGPDLVALRAEHPDPAHAMSVLRTLGLNLEVSAASRPALVATFQTERGPVTLY
ncbi:MAG: VOC family protein [Terriglobia bacterium]